jgi:hypothetical protein
MMRYLEVPEAELDNNSIEHALRSVVLGRKRPVNRIFPNRHPDDRHQGGAQAARSLPA